jgi:hypothetical protein
VPDRSKERAEQDAQDAAAERAANAPETQPNPANAQAAVTAGALPEGTPGVVPSAPGGPVVVGAPPDLSQLKQELLAEIAAGMPPKQEYNQGQKDAVRDAVLYFKSLAQAPWLPVDTQTVIQHMATLAEIAATGMGHTVDASFLAGRTGSPHERAPGKDDLPESRR